MNFRIADSFTASLDRFTGDEQKTAKATAFDLQMDPAGKGLSFHRLDLMRSLDHLFLRRSRRERAITSKQSGDEFFRVVTAAAAGESRRG